MNQLGVKLNAPIYTAIIQCLVDEGNVEMALRYMMAMKKQDVVPELSAAQAVVILAADCGYSRLAIDIATYFENVSVRRLEDSAWIACLASSARNLYVRPFIRYSGFILPF
jgi:pentatricopeptide repeat protein